MPQPPANGMSYPQTISDLLLPGNPFLGTLPRKYWFCLKKAFAYGVDYLPLTAGASGVQQSITIDSDSDFVLMLPQMIVTDSTNLIQKSFAPALINLSSSLNNQFMFQTARHVMTFASIPGVVTPQYLPMAYIYPKGTVLNTLLSNLDLVNTYNYRFTYWGFKAYTQVPADGGDGSSSPSDGTTGGMGAYPHRGFVRR
jgi:hypothetical protein